MGGVGGWGIRGLEGWRVGGVEGDWGVVELRKGWMVGSVCG